MSNTPLVTNPQPKPRLVISRPHSTISGRTSGSPPTVFTSTRAG